MKKIFLSVVFSIISCFLFAQTKIVKSDDGLAQFESKDVWVSVILVDDLKSTINSWKSVAENEPPKISSTTHVSLENSFIAPFIVYKINTKKAAPIYYDCELIEPNGTTSAYKGNKLLFWKNKPENMNLLYSVAQNYGWGFDETDSEGTYIIKIKIYTEKKQLTEFELTFDFQNKSTFNK